MNAYIMKKKRERDRERKRREKKIVMISYYELKINKIRSKITVPRHLL